MTEKFSTAEEYLAGHNIDYSGKSSGLDLMLPEEFYPNLYRALKSNLFYVFIVPNSSRFIELMMDIEYKYYDPKTTRNREFGLTIRPGEPAIVYVLGKKYLPKKDLWDILSNNGGESLLGPVTKEQFLNDGIDFITLTDDNRFNTAAVMNEVMKFREYYNTQEMK